MTTPAAACIKIVGDKAEQVLTLEAQAFLAKLQRTFNARRQELLQLRAKRGIDFNFLPETRGVRDDESWTVAAAPLDLQKRWVEITGPVERKMMINALNSGADVFMADFEDALSPSWKNVLDGQINLTAAIEHTLTFSSPEGKSYKLNENTAVLVVRPRGWHLVEKHFIVDEIPMSASLFDFGLYFFRNAKKLIEKGTGPYFYLPKMESHLEARLWNEVFNFAQKELSIPSGTIRATVLIETLPAAFEMEEILYELRDHCAGLNAGRWDYIFSAIKKFRSQPEAAFPDRGQITMIVPFMRAYTELLVQTCHKRGAHAMGGMAAYIPSRKNSEVNAKAMSKVREDKLRESQDGFDGTWVAHPDLVPVAYAIFREALQGKPHQKGKLRNEVSPIAHELLDFNIPGGRMTEGGARQNINVALQYLDSWLRGIGAAAIDNLMEDAATAEISRAQLWQLLHHSTTLDQGQRFTPDIYRAIADEEQIKICALPGPHDKIENARRLLDTLVLDNHFSEFLTLLAYDQLD